MKILFLTRRFWPQIGGVEKHVLEVSKRLVKKGHEVVVVAEATHSLIPQPRRSPCGSPSEVFDSSTSGESFGHPRGVFTAYRIPVGKDDWLKKFRLWGWFFKNRKLIQKAEIIHAHDVGFWYWPFRLLYPLKPFFITFHGWEGEFPIPLKNKIVRKISEKMARGNICVGDYIKEWYGTKADCVTYGGVSLFPPPRRSRGRCLATSEVFSPLVFIGRLEKDTGLPIYLESLKSLKTLKLPVLFLGDGKLREEAKKHGKVLGFVKETRPYLLKSRFVFTSGYLAILEAMVCQRLVFAVYDNPLKKDYLKMAPFADWIIIEREPKDLTEKLEYYLDHPEEERKLVSQAYRWVKKQSWEKVAGWYLRLWRKQ